MCIRDRKFARPWCFKNVATLPTKYANHNKSWIMTKVFEDWLRGVHANNERKTLTNPSVCGQMHGPS